MTQELAALTDAGFSSEKIALIKQMVAPDASDLELQLFLYTCKKTGLDPLTRQIYAIKRGGKMTIQTGIDGYRVVADRTGKLAGISDPSYTEPEGGKYPLTASVCVKKAIGDGIIADFTATARWGEYNAGGPMWQKMPFLMLGKCAEALALRKAFPADLSGVYTTEEMQQADNDAQRDAVYAEVERQKAAYVPTAKEVFCTPASAVAYIKPDGTPIYSAVEVSSIPPPPPFIHKGDYVWFRILDAKMAKSRDGKRDMVAVKMDGQIEGKDVVFYWHSTQRDLLLNSIGKHAKVKVKTDAKKFTQIDNVIEIDGENAEVPIMPAESTLEVKARFLASALDMDEETLRELHGSACKGDWKRVVDTLENKMAEQEVVK